MITWGGDDPFTHALIIGPTRCGKTSKILKPMIYTILLAKKRGEKVGLTIIEPKGDVTRMVKEMAEQMGLKDELVYIDPLYPDETQKINVMRGDKNDVTEATVAVLKSLFGKQDAFFATVQELSSRKVTLLLKELYHDDMDILDVLANLRDADLLKQNVEAHRQQYGNTDLITFFDNELLGSGQMAEKYRQFIVGLRSQLENITSNEFLRAIVTGKSDIDLDEHLRNGGILAVNTALGKLGRSGDAFGMFITMHMQLASFRRPGTERTRVPHYLIIDEYSRYINPDVEKFLSIAAEYRVALIAAIQSLGQLEIESGATSGRAMKRNILNSVRNKIFFGGLEYEDAAEASKIMGSNVMLERTRTFDGGVFQNILPKAYREEEVEKERFLPTLFMDGLPRFYCICKLLIGGTPQEPIVAVGEFVPDNWLEKLNEEQENRKFENQKRPPFFKVRERALYDVELFEHQEKQKKAAEALKVLKADNPFEDVPLIDNLKQVPLIENLEGSNDIIPNEPVNELIFSIGKSKDSTSSVSNFSPVIEENINILEKPVENEVVKEVVKTEKCNDNIAKPPKEIKEELVSIIQTNVQSKNVEEIVEKGQVEQVEVPLVITEQNSNRTIPKLEEQLVKNKPTEIIDYYPSPSGSFDNTEISQSKVQDTSGNSKDNDVFDESDSGFW